MPKSRQKIDITLDNSSEFSTLGIEPFRDKTIFCLYPQGHIQVAHTGIM